MFTNGAFKNPLAVNVETVVETARKNFAVLTSANTAAVETIKTIAQRQGDMVRAAMEDLSKHGSEVLAAATVEEKAIKNIEFAKKAYETAMANAKEIGDMVGKSQTEAFDALNARVAELTEEVKAALAAKK